MLVKVSTVEGAAASKENRLELKMPSSRSMIARTNASYSRAMPLSNVQLVKLLLRCSKPQDLTGIQFQWLTRILFLPELPKLSKYDDEGMQAVKFNGSRKQCAR